MNRAPDVFERVSGSEPLTEALVRERVSPFFSRVLEAQRGRIYLANHSLGRPLDAAADDVREGLALWYARLGDAWDDWAGEMTAYRSRLAALAGAPRVDSIVPKTSAGQGLRAVLNTYDRAPRVVATRGEFDSLDVILREYARRGRVTLTFVEPDADGLFGAQGVLDAIEAGAELIVISQVMFQSGQVMPGLPKIVAAAQSAGARVLLDVYHSLGVFPVDLAALDVDFAVGGSYKYLRGGPGACFLYVAPRHLDTRLATLDTGWFAKESPFTYARPDPPRFAAGGDAWLESTPPVLPLYQARAGQRFTQAIGVPRLRAYSLELQNRLLTLLAERSVAAQGGTADRGAFVTVRHRAASALATELGARGIKTDARGEWLRLCPDLLTTEAELMAVASALGELIRR